MGSVSLPRALSPQGHLHDRYGQLVNIYTKLLLTKISFHLKVVSSGESWGWWDPGLFPPRCLRGWDLSCPHLAQGGAWDRWQGSQKARRRFPAREVVLAPPSAPGGRPILCVLVSGVTARGRWWLHRLGGFSSPFPPSKARSGAGPELRGAAVEWGCPLRSTPSSLRAWR